MPQGCHENASMHQGSVCVHAELLAIDQLCFVQLLLFSHKYTMSAKLKVKEGL